MLYPTRPGGETWALSDNPLADPRFGPRAPLSRNPDGSWKVRSSQVRLEVFTSAGYRPEAISTYERRLLVSRGYMQSPNDWKNVEMTGYVRLNARPRRNDNFSWYARGGHHEQVHPCEGSAYKGDLHYDGSARWQKESWHVSYVGSPFAQATASLQGRWVGFKAIMRNVPTPSGREAVRLELWLDEDANPKTWRRVYAMTDKGRWGGTASHCEGAPDAMPITWGGPIATFRWDGASDVDFKWLSVREIE
jgi:hypothetical protein